MSFERLVSVLETIGPLYLLLGILAFAAFVAVLLLIKDARLAFVPFLLAIYVINVENTTAFMLLWVLRWLFLIVLATRSLRYIRTIGPFSAGQIIYLILILWSLFMAFHAPHPTRGFAIFAIMFLTFFGVLFTIISEVKDEYAFLRFIHVFVYVSLIIVIGAAIAFAAKGFRVASTMGARLSGIFANPSVFAGGLAIAVPPLVWRMLRVRNWAKKAFYFVLFIVGSALTFLTGSRGAIGVVIVGVTVLFARYNIRLVLPLVLLLFFGVYAVLPFVQEMPGSSRFMAHVTGETGLTGRGELWATAFGLLKENPFTGHGTGVSTDEQDRTCPVSSFHNAYLDSAVDLGILGPILWITLYIIYSTKAFKLCFSKYISPEMRSISWLLLGNLLALSLLGIFAGAPVSVTNLASYWILMNVAVIISAERIVEAQKLELYEGTAPLQEPAAEYGESAYYY